MLRGLLRRLWSLARKRPLLRDALAWTYSAFGGNRKVVHGTGNAISHHGTLMKRVSFDIRGTGNRITIARGAKIANVKIHIRGQNHRLLIGENCEIRAGEFWLEDADCQIEVGCNTTIESAHLAATEPGSMISIGDDCMLAYDIDIRTGDSHAIIDLNTGKRINQPGHVLVGDHVWLAAHVTVLKGTTIGNNSVIGTGTIVTKPIPENSIAVGIPARVSRTNISWKRDRIQA